MSNVSYVGGFDSDTPRRPPVPAARRPGLALGDVPKYADSASSNVHAVLRSVETMIMATPSGEARNHLCDAQIHLNEAIAHLQKVAGV